MPGARRITRVAYPAGAGGACANPAPLVSAKTATSKQRRKTRMRPSKQTSAESIAGRLRKPRREVPIDSLFRAATVAGTAETGAPHALLKMPSPAGSMAFLDLLGEGLDRENKERNRGQLAASLHRHAH